MATKMQTYSDKLLIKDTWLNRCIEEAFEEMDGNLIDIAEYLQDVISDIFDIDKWSAFDGPNYKYFIYNDLLYKIEIEEDGICEVTNDHRYVYWNIKVILIDKTLNGDKK